MSAKQTVAKLLADGASVSVISETLGLDTGTILALLDDPEVRIAYRQAAAERLNKSLEIDHLITLTEEKALCRLHGALDTETDARKLATVFSLLNKASRRVERPEERGLSDEGTVVNLVLPAGHVERRQRKEVEYKLDANNQVVEVDGKALVTMDGNQVKQLAAASNPRLAELLKTHAGSHVITLEDL